MNAVEVPKELAHIHALKHACCSIQARAGAKIENIAQYVGHKDIKNTRTYLNVSDDEAAVSAFNALDSLTRKH
jgi:site-specific recombinase XerD